MDGLISPKDDIIDRIPQSPIYPPKARLSIFGLGYVGAVSAACFTHSGHIVIGVDPDSSKVEKIGSGQSPIVEPGLSAMLKSGVDDYRLYAFKDVGLAISSSDISLVCVGTPSDPDGRCDLKYLREVSKQIGQELKEKDAYHLIVFRSTVPPGTTRKVMLPIIEKASGKTCGRDFGLCFHPEFLRESTAIADFYDPPKTVVGAFDEKSAKSLAAIYEGIDDRVIHTSIEAAEMVKYVDNTWHALKVSFANEIGKVCWASDIDSHDVMDIFVQDTKLNISSYYMKPGFAFGGSCLPKDVRGINHLAHDLGIKTPILNSIISSNEAQIDHAVSLITHAGGKTIGFLGLTFKAGTDDLRESPMLAVITALLGHGYKVKIFDPNLDIDSSVRHHIQHSSHAKDAAGDLMRKLPKLMCNTPEDACKKVDTIVVSHPDPAFRNAVTRRGRDQHVVDLARVFDREEGWPEMRQAGMDDFLQKPAGRSQLLGKLSQWTGKLSGGALNILLAEDDPSYAAVTKAILIKAGHKVRIVKNGIEALRQVNRESFDAILMDVEMPDMTGLEATSRIRSMHGIKSTMPIIALTGLAQPERSNTYSGICW
ncbi:MAG: nucleotide sugar dehydrogenase [Rhodospirillales bacterium]|nr:nucleotide sugar dehydrogenase [Rhodospirillales bacterium]